ncbi:hypothetical protein PPERSA_11079 [Pseudocohnilembus persalinus]|uniref:Insulin-like growth factor binding protein, N-terminal n=1 Tax=Pseudocohnilembus persalinus TaxID=266149 RepID=A0A0V0QZQ5_PSEPJ|nr:hypothetical protein PPERSA_11079 [Pseudocohnilembus persalinus]|eukprot:KRX07530.1 hypothetical protein PPERSA_11079 [Pseudocohnilembus persalinus]
MQNQNCIQVLVLAILLSLSTVSATRELSTNGVCYIEQCGCPEAFLATWCGDASQLADPWCQKNDSNCGNCAGVWCQQQQVDSGKGTCYIEQCGCPGEFKLDYCSSQNVLPQGFCQESEVNCGNCAGVWCGGQDNNTDDQTDNNESSENQEEEDGQGVCYISQCGCPGKFKLDYCSENIHMLPAGYCQESKNNCVNNCDGAWCNQSSKRVLTSQNGRCFIGQCGCPGNYYLDWCSEENQLTSSYCTESSENCELCDGVWKWCLLY